MTVRVMFSMSDSEISKIIERLEAISHDLAVLKTKLPTVAEQGVDHEARIRSLESSFWKAFGAVSLVAVVLPIIVGFLT